MDKQKASVSVDHAKCVPCSGLICIGVCPEAILEQGKDKKPKFSDQTSCTLCGVCVDLCPSKAISIETAEKSKAKSRSR